MLDDPMIMIMTMVDDGTETKMACLAAVMKMRHPSAVSAFAAVRPKDGGPA